jgi:hypothetical protein
VSADEKLTAEAGAVTLTRREMVSLTGDDYCWGNYDAPPPRGPLEYALSTLQARANDLHVLSAVVDTDFDADKLGMVLLRLAYKMKRSRVS